ncbi:MAG: glycosyltransferase family A protein [Candidatus Thorarchaeota archaeon]|jgi:glycosyltransferase involved in cell wall biosynthesis
MKASLSITTFNRQELTEVTLLSVLATVPRDDCEIIVVDNCSTDGTKEMLLDYYGKGDIDVLHINNWNKQLGVSSNNAIDLAHPEAEWLILLANDEYCMDGWWENFCKCTQDPGIEALYTSLRAHNVYDEARQQVFTGKYGGKMLVYDPEVKIGAGLAMRHSMIKRIGFRFLERWYNILGSIYTVAHEDFDKKDIPVFELAKPCVLSQNCEFDSEQYKEYYDEFFGLRHTTDRLARLRHNPEGYFTLDSRKALELFYEGSDYDYYGGSEANKRKLLTKITSRIPK